MAKDLEIIKKDSDFKVIIDGAEIKDLLKLTFEAKEYGNMTLTLQIDVLGG